MKNHSVSFFLANGDLLHFCTQSVDACIRLEEDKRLVVFRKGLAAEMQLTTYRMYCDILNLDEALSDAFEHRFECETADGLPFISGAERVEAVEELSDEQLLLRYSSGHEFAVMRHSLNGSDDLLEMLLGVMGEEPSVDATADGPDSLVCVMNAEEHLIYFCTASVESYESSTRLDYPDNDPYEPKILVHFNSGVDMVVSAPMGPSFRVDGRLDYLLDGDLMTRAEGPGDDELEQLLQMSPEDVAEIERIAALYEMKL